MFFIWAPTFSKRWKNKYLKNKRKWALFDLCVFCTPYSQFELKYYYIVQVWLRRVIRPSFQLYQFWWDIRNCLTSLILFLFYQQPKQKSIFYSKYWHEIGLQKNPHTQKIELIVLQNKSPFTFSRRISNKIIRKFGDFKWKQKLIINRLNYYKCHVVW